MELSGRIVAAPDHVAPTTFEISITKAAELVSLPTTYDCVHRYLAEEGRLA
jgi:hypothetical protein